MITRIAKVEAEVGDYSYTTEVSVDWHTESNWGADADGNRGIERSFVDDIILDEDVTEIDEDGKERIIPVDKLSAKVYCTLEGAALVSFQRGGNND